jgi:quinol monooxygenase YgiN
MKAMLANAEASVREEAKCLVFDVLEAHEEPDTFYLYEVYTDAEALQDHKETAHYRSTRAVVNELITEQSVIRAEVVAMNPAR